MLDAQPNGTTGGCPGRAVFGVDDCGNVNPSSEEVAEITEHHTDRLVELLERLRDIDDRLANSYGGGATRYSTRKTRLTPRTRVLLPIRGGLW